MNSIRELNGTDQGPLKQMDVIALKCWFSKWRCHFKSDENIITKFIWLKFQILRIQQKKSLMEVALHLPTFQPSWKWSFFTIFYNTEPRDRTDYNPAFYFEVFWCSNNLILKMTSTITSIYEIIHLKVFFKIALKF